MKDYSLMATVIKQGTMVPRRLPTIFVGGIGGQNLVTKLTNTAQRVAFVKLIKQAHKNP